MEGQSAGRAHHVLRACRRILAQVLAILVGFALMVVGLGLGVTLIMLPVGLAVGLVGVLIFVWGLLGHLDRSRR